MKIYKKVMNRSIPLISAQCWYEGERFGLAEFTEGNFFFEPFFVYKKGQGIGVYYDFSDPVQAPEMLAEYFFKHRDKFEKLITAYRSDCREILRLVCEKDQGNFEIIYKIIIRTWPILVVSSVIGKMQDNAKFKDLVDIAYDLRIKHDKIIYDAEKYLLRLAREKFPLALSESASFLFFEEMDFSGVSAVRERIEARKTGFIYAKGMIETGISLEEFCKKNSIVIAPEERDNKVQVLSGSIACKGTATGRVTIVFETSQLDKVKDGDILIAPMTTPDFMPAMKRAVAFVTDEGGITCHAAIVAREMEKPCIIGTKIATKVLKDGDIVEVDANMGIIKILK